MLFYCVGTFLHLIPTDFLQNFIFKKFFFERDVDFYASYCALNSLLLDKYNRFLSFVWFFAPFGVFWFSCLHLFAFFSSFFICHYHSIILPFCFASMPFAGICFYCIFACIILFSFFWFFLSCVVPTYPKDKHFSRL